MIPKNIFKDGVGALENISDIRVAAAEKAKAELIRKLMNEEPSNISVAGTTPSKLSGPEKLGWEIISVTPKISNGIGPFSNDFNHYVVYE